MHIIITVLHKNTAAELYVSNSAALILFFCICNLVWNKFFNCVCIHLHLYNVIYFYVLISDPLSDNVSERHVMHANNASSYPNSKITP